MENFWTEGHPWWFPSGRYLEESQHAEASSSGSDGEVWSPLSCLHPGIKIIKSIGILVLLTSINQAQYKAVFARPKIKFYVLYGTWIISSPILVTNKDMWNFCCNSKCSWSWDF